jgi:hypothetical protein
VPGGLRPSACVPRRLHRVADILSVADPGMAEKLAALRIDGLRIAAVGTRLLAADIHLGGAVEAGGVDGLGRGGRVDGFGGFEGRVGLEVGHQPLPPAFAAEAAFADPAERRGGVEEVRGVHPDDTGRELGRDVEREVEVLRPEGRGEAVARVVGQLHRLGRRAEGAGDEDGAEDLLLHQGRGGGKAGDERRRVEAALSAACPLRRGRPPPRYWRRQGG